ncbi:TetR/AcrR family transcriptional regulator [Modestobacter roseus]|uniref:TetR family transcriptional regulator n=1 Tax=Modestobacter roseus TaxID=1181884 RepID=A0A562IWW3_9ACTN|nr:TetR/AcrR family transcriptional regulator [Modestobacter roseus]TWH75313.1 TetR family transcriptional regulator [Modestobacter roseus]
MTEATGGRRELRKAQTRAEIRSVAQRLFAERGFDGVTIADVAAAADVAVQTVFNHFPTKEDLFFDGRTPWVEGTAESVAQRAGGQDPTAALRAYLQADLTALLEQETRPENRSYLEALAQSPSLQARERSLVEQAWQLVAGELLAATTADGTPLSPVTTQFLSELTGALFMVAGRVLVLEHRRLVLAEPADEAEQAEVRRHTEATLGALEECLRTLAGRLADGAAEA